jgi:threonine/homoserine/homoserine lactone efflux protein
MDTGAVAAFWLVTFLLIIVPGADWAFTLSASLRGNAVLAAVGGLATGYAALTAVVAAGIGALVARSAVALTGITLVGGAYLIGLGLATLRHPSTPSTGTDVDARSNRSTFAEGIGVSGLNPKGLLILIALLPQFTSSHAGWPIAVQLAVLGAMFTLTCAAFYLILGTFARAVLRARPVAARALSRLSGIGMTLLGAILITQRLLP